MFSGHSVFSLYIVLGFSSPEGRIGLAVLSAKGLAAAALARFADCQQAAVWLAGLTRYHFWELWCFYFSHFSSFHIFLSLFVYCRIHYT
jgi:hypothetical protein